MPRFSPPQCPYQACPSRQGAPFQFQSRGTYTRRCDGRTVPKFRCKTCGRHFSAQTFRLDYGLRKAWLNPIVAQHLCAKTTLRKTAEILGVKRRTVERRMNLFGRHARDLHFWLLARHKRTRGGVHCPTMVLDELETFETDRRLQPVTVPVLVEKHSHFILHVDTAPLPARGPLSPRNEARKQAFIKRFGRRRSGSRAAVKRTLQSWKDFAAPLGLTLHSDKKRTYRAVLREVFPGEGVSHVTTPGNLPRTSKNRLFPVNQTNALLRDSISRLVRRNWAASKRRPQLERHLWIFVVFRNLVRGKTRKKWHGSSAMEVGLLRRKLEWKEVLRWRAPFFGLLRAT